MKEIEKNVHLSMEAAVAKICRRKTPDARINGSTKKNYSP